MDRRIQYSGILLIAGNKVLSYEHLRQLPWLSARLVVLPACRSGTAAITVEHVISLPGAFLAAGAVGVIGTFWHSDELATFLLLQRFYKLWASGTSAPVEALGDAQEWLMSFSADVLQQRSRKTCSGLPRRSGYLRLRPNEIVYRHPWYWSNFFLAGA